MAEKFQNENNPDLLDRALHFLAVITAAVALVVTMIAQLAVLLYGFLA
jgi:hypothetical protein